jgi:UvrB/UvrC motif-containing protein
MKEAASDLEFETAARLRDEIKRLTAVELTIADDPFARQSAVDDAVDQAFLAPSATGILPRESRRSESQTRSPVNLTGVWQYCVSVTGG